MAGGVDDIDTDTVPFDRCAFGKDCDTAFALLIVGIHNTFGNTLVVPERAGLPQ